MQRGREDGGGATSIQEAGAGGAWGPLQPASLLKRTADPCRCGCLRGLFDAWDADFDECASFDLTKDVIVS
eukprot:9495664-Pyramimonas_sp.AAC.1